MQQFVVRVQGSKIIHIIFIFSQINIKQQSEQQAKEHNLTWDVSQEAKNHKLNRYMDVNPYDHSRIKLRHGDTDYINANLVKMPNANRKYILTQGPLRNTVSHFWTMVWEQNSQAILMLNKIIEKNQVCNFKHFANGLVNNIFSSSSSSGKMSHVLARA